MSKRKTQADELLVVDFTDCRVSSDSAKFPEFRGQLRPQAWRLRTARSRLAHPVGFGRQCDAQRFLQLLHHRGIKTARELNGIDRDELDQIVGEALQW